MHRTSGYRPPRRPLAQRIARGAATLALLSLFAAGAVAVARNVTGTGGSGTPSTSSTVPSSVPSPGQPLDPFDAAIGRLAAGTPEPNDLFAVLVDDDVVAAYVPDGFGTLTLTGEGPFASYGYWDRIVGNGDLVNGWVQERTWSGPDDGTTTGGTFVEETLLADGPETASRLREGWKRQADSAGLVSRDDQVDDSSTLTVSYVDDSTGSARCTTQSITGSGPLVVLVTLYQAGPCTSGPAALVAFYADTLTVHAAVLTGWK